MCVAEPNLWRTSLRCAGMERGLPLAVWLIDQVLQLLISELVLGLVLFPYPP